MPIGDPNASYVDVHVERKITHHDHEGDTDHVGKEHAAAAIKAKAEAARDTYDSVQLARARFGLLADKKGLNANSAENQSSDPYYRILRSSL